MSFGCTPDFTKRSVGYVGFSDGWQDLMDNFKMDWEFEQATDGNIALTGEIDLSHGMEFTPVSYTHLDVYKRQALNPMPPAIRAFIIIFSTCRPGGAPGNASYQR